MEILIGIRCKYEGSYCGTAWKRWIVKLTEKETFSTEWVHGNTFDVSFDNAQNSSDFAILMAVIDKVEFIDTGRVSCSSCVGQLTFLDYL